MIEVQLTSGGPPRGTELVNMLVRNIQTRTRNLYGLNNHLAIIRQYDKTSNNHQNDKLIPNGLDAFISDIIIQLHTLARPFAAFLATKVFPNDPSVPCQYAEMLFMDFGKPFDSKTLSRGLATWSHSILGWELTLNSHRHCYVAWHRRLSHSLNTLIQEAEGTSTVATLQTGHAKSTEDRIYGLTREAMLGSSSEMIQLYLNNSAEWQHQLRLVPGINTGRELMLYNAISINSIR
jgi:hypothetical protein